MLEPKTILIAGASRGIGLGLVAEYLSRGWQVIATARAPDKAAGLTALQPAGDGRLTIEALDIVDPASVARLVDRLSGRTIDLLFVVAGVSGHSHSPVHEVPDDAIAHEFVTNATSPVKLAEALQPRLAPEAPVAFMTSILGSIGSNAGGGMELYRATKAALNMLASCYALRHRGASVLLLHPGWVRTELGGTSAPVEIATSVGGLADVIEAHGNKAGIAYLDYQGTKLPW